MRKLRKVFSLVLALAMCLGLTIPAFAESYTYGYSDGIIITAYSNGSLSYIGAGTLRAYHVDDSIECLDYAGFIIDGSDYVFGSDTISISIGPGITVADDFKEVWYAVSRDLGLSVTFNNSTTAETIASPSNDGLEVNGAVAVPTVYKINDSNYFKIRDVAAMLNGTEKQFSVGYDGTKNAVTATTGESYDRQSGDLEGPAKGGRSADPSNDAIYVNGEKITAEVYKINGSNYFKLRDLGKALNFYVGWSAERGMYIETGKPYSE